MEKFMKVFLGGTCNGSTWREDLIPHLEIDYFNPVVDDWNEEAQKEEIVQREECDIVLYTITPKMIGTYAIAEVVDDSNKRPEKTVFCILDYESHSEEVFTLGQKKSLQSVGEMVKRNGGKVFESYCDVAEYINALSKAKDEDLGKALKGYLDGGLKDKYTILKKNGTGTNPKADYFVLRLDTDPHAQKAILKYAESVRKDNPKLADEIGDKMVNEYGWEKVK